MKINYFDLGLYNGDEIQMFLDAVKPMEADVKVYGFEAHLHLAEKVAHRYHKNKNVQIINRAISDKNGMTKLYIANGNKMEGNSIFPTKENVNPEEFVEVECVKFSDWIANNVPFWWRAKNVIRFNIEGAEIHLMDDIISTGVFRKIDLFLGSKGGVDILKCSEIVHLHENYLQMLADYEINVHQYCAVDIGNISDEYIREYLAYG